MEAGIVLSPPLQCDLAQASVEIYRTMGRVLNLEAAMKYRMTAGEGCGLEIWRKLYHDSEGFSDQVLDIKSGSTRTPPERRTSASWRSSCPNGKQ